MDHVLECHVIFLKSSSSSISYHDIAIPMYWQGYYGQNQFAHLY